MYKREFLKTTSKVIAGATLAPDALSGDLKGAWCFRSTAIGATTKVMSKVRRAATDLACLLASDGRLGSHSRANHRKEDAVARPMERFQNSRHRVATNVPPIHRKHVTLSSARNLVRYVARAR